MKSLIFFLTLATLFPISSVFADSIEDAILDSTVKSVESKGGSNSASPEAIAKATVTRSELIQYNQSAGMTYEEAVAAADAKIASGGPTTVIVTERIPGAECVCAVDNRDANDIRMGMTLESQCGDATTRKYICTLPEGGLSGFQVVFAQIVRWFVYISMLLGVIAIIGAGVLWAFGSESEEYTKKAKGWVVNIFIGLLLLFTFRYILGFLAPWIFR